MTHLSEGGSGNFSVPPLSHTIRVLGEKRQIRLEEEGWGEKRKNTCTQHLADLESRPSFILKKKKKTMEQQHHHDHDPQYSHVRATSAIVAVIVTVLVQVLVPRSEVRYLTPLEAKWLTGSVIGLGMFLFSLLLRLDTFYLAVNHTVAYVLYVFLLVPHYGLAPHAFWGLWLALVGGYIVVCSHTNTMPFVMYPGWFIHRASQQQQQPPPQQPKFLLRPITPFAAPLPEALPHAHQQ